MFNLPLKPLSVNAAYTATVKKVKSARGYKYHPSMQKSKAYKQYAKDLPLLLPPMHQLPPGKLVFIVKFYFATAASDIDNPIKAMQDLICDYYGVNDNKIYMLLVEKHVAGKGNERIEFEFLEYHEGMFEKCREMIIKTDGNEDETQ
ncbi:MAG: RusA family crossover junction endodeoxyribonuclease [Bacteroidetes bacterium]|nr:RusA family crossover junction endodeoxyribonuclease [Bacteroidota bacterium]